uniref:C4-dicarboxylate transporter malic acid transport n=1 Tax=Moniliophthora roreri TaxID=221103 RepID=A0A0W0GBY7_MONRR
MASQDPCPSIAYVYDDDAERRFAVTMGTGSISLLFYAFPYGHDSEATNIMSLVFFFLNLALFTLFTVISIARYVIFPGVWSTMLSHPVQSLYTGTFPMGATTLFNIAVNLINQRYHFGGKGFLYTIWVVWWLDVAISIICCWGMLHVMQTTHNHSLERMTAAWLLPVVTLIVASSSGGVLAPALHAHNPSYALLTETFSMFMVTIGLALALMLLTVYLMRLIIHGLPPGATIISVFLPLGPTGQAGYSILLGGQYFKSVLPLGYGSSEVLNSRTAGENVNVICVCIAFVLWSLASMWFIFALMGVQHVLRRSRIPFKVPFWGLIFPNGVYANLTISLGNTFDSPFFHIWGSIYAGMTLLLWTLVAIRTVIMVYTTEIFEAPCLEDVDLGRITPVNGNAAPVAPFPRSLKERATPTRWDGRDASTSRSRETFPNL